MEFRKYFNADALDALVVEKAASMASSERLIVLNADGLPREVTPMVHLVWADADDPRWSEVRVMDEGVHTVDDLVIPNDAAVENLRERAAFIRNSMHSA